MQDKRIPILYVIMYAKYPNGERFGVHIIMTKELEKKSVNIGTKRKRKNSRGEPDRYRLQTYDVHLRKARKRVKQVKKVHI